jgi:hypothetical protein
MSDIIAKKIDQFLAKHCTGMDDHDDSNCAKCEVMCDELTDLIAEEYKPLRELLVELVSAYGDYSRADKFVDAMKKAEKLVEDMEGQ